MFVEKGFYSGFYFVINKMLKRIKNRYSKVIGFKDHKIGLYDIKTFIED